MGELLKKEWNLCFRRQLIIHTAVLFAGAAVGFILLNLVLRAGAETTYIYLGSLFAILSAGIYSFAVVNRCNTRFVLGVSFGQKRKNLILCSVLFLLLFTAVSYIGIMVVLIFEKNVYPVLFSGRAAEGTGIFPVMAKWGLLIIALVYLILWLLFVLYMKYGGIVFGIIYVLGITVCILGSRFPWAGTLLMRIMCALAAMPVFLWTAAGIVSGMLFVMISSGILMKIDVKY